MLGHVLFKYLHNNSSNKVIGVARKKNFNKLNFSSIQLNDIKLINSLTSVKSIVNVTKPDLVINCIGVIKQSSKISNLNKTLIINSKFPHDLANISNEKNYFKLIQISTDCVFNGSKGNYFETSVPNCDDIYGISKLLGEVKYSNHLTLRTSIIGPELKNKTSLFEWFLNEEKVIDGYSKAYFSGITTLEFAKIFSKYFDKIFRLKGLYNISSNKISKFDLLTCINKSYNLNKKIQRNKTYVINRSLNSDKFLSKIGYKKKSWQKMLYEQKNEYQNL